MSGNPSQLSVVVTTSSPGFAWACLHAAGIDASRAAILTTPGASIGGLEDSLGRTLAAMIGLTRARQIVVLAHAADPVYRVGAEGLSERAERNGIRPARAGWGDSIPYPRLAKNADRTVGRAVQAIANASWVPPQTSVVGIVVSEDGSADTVALEAAAAHSTDDPRTQRDEPAAISLDSVLSQEPRTPKLDHSWLSGDDDTGGGEADEKVPPEVADLFGADARSASLGQSSSGGPVGSGEVPDAGPVGQSGPLASGPTGLGGPLASGPTGLDGPLSSGPTGLDGPLASGPVQGGRSSAAGPVGGGGPLVNAAADGPLSSGSAGDAPIPDAAPQGTHLLESRESALEDLPVTSVESLGARPPKKPAVRPPATGAVTPGRTVSARRENSRRTAESDLEERLEQAAAVLARFVHERCYQHSLRRDMKHLIRTGASPETVMRNLLALVRDLAQDLPDVRAAYGTLEMARSTVDRRTLESLLRSIVL